jgi:hypothetical protein
VDDSNKRGTFGTVIDGLNALGIAHLTLLEPNAKDAGKGVQIKQVADTFRPQITVPLIVNTGFDKAKGNAFIAEGKEATSPRNCESGAVPRPSPEAFGFDLSAQRAGEVKRVRGRAIQYCSEGAAGFAQNRQRGYFACRGDVDHFAGASTPRCCGAQRQRSNRDVDAKCGLPCSSDPDASETRLTAAHSRQ